MPLTNAGCVYLAQAAIAAGLQTNLNNAGAYLGVGDSTTVHDVAQTDLQGTNKIRKPMDPNYPTVSGNKITFESTYLGDEANWAWQEWGVFNAASAGTMLSRKVEYNGTKLAGQTWILQVELTFEPGQ